MTILKRLAEKELAIPILFPFVLGTVLVFALRAGVNNEEPIFVDNAMEYGDLVNPFLTAQSFAPLPRTSQGKLYAFMGC